MTQAKPTAPLLVRAARGEATERVPVWLMRQAGRYLSEYRAIRDKYDFLTVVKTPDLAAEVSLQPWRLFRPDGVIMFSDILTPLEGMGIPFLLDEGGPNITAPVQSAADLARVRVVDPLASMPYVFDLIRMLRREVDGAAAVLGFAGAPYTLASYAVGKGRGKKESAIKSMAFAEPATLHALLGLLTEQTIAYVAAQIDAGVDAVQLFDTWAGELSEADYREFALPYQRQVFDAVRGRVPTILYALGTSAYPHLLAESGADVLSVDWRIALDKVRAGLGRDVILQGNLDPAVLLAPAAVVTARTEAILAQGGGRRHLFNLGHGLLPPTPRENVALVIDTVKQWRPRPTT